MGNLSVEPKVTRSMLLGILLKKTLVASLLFFLLISAAGAKEYIVKPVPSYQAGVSIKGEKITEYPVEGEKITEYGEYPVYWQTLLLVPLFDVIYLTCMNLYICRFIYIITGFRIAGSVNVLANSSRHRIYTYIENKPGAYVSEIVENTGLNRGTVQYHLQILEAKNKIEAYEDGVKIRYFQNTNEYSEEEKKVLMALQNTTNQRIVSEILHNKCNTNIDLAREFGVSKSTISWYVKSLKETGVIKETKRGRNIIYKINTSYKSLINRYK